MATPVRLDVGINSPKLFAEIVNTVKQAENAIKRNPIRFEAKNFGALKSINAEIDRFDKSLTRMSAVIQTFGQSAAIMFGIQNAMVGLAKATVNVEKDLVDLNSVLGGTTSQLNALSDGLFKVAKETGQSFKIVTESAKEFSRQGLGIEETLKRTRDALILTRTTGFDAAAATEALTAAVNTFRKEALDTTKVINTFANVDTKFAVSSADLAEGIKRAGASAQDAKVDFNELVATITSLQQTTARGGSNIGNSIKSIFTRINRESSLDLLEGLGVQARNMDGSIRPAIDILKELAQVFPTLSDAQRNQTKETLAGVYQINAFSALLGDLSNKYGAYNEALRTATGTTDEAIRKNEALNKSTAALINEALANLTQFAAKAGEIALNPVFKNLLGGLNAAFDNLPDFDGETFGSKIGKGILEGIGNVLSGPGLAVLAVAFAKITRLVLQGAADQFKSVISLGKENEKILQIQQKVKGVLQSQDPAIQRLIAGTKNRQELEAAVLNTINKETESLLYLEKLSYQVSKNLARMPGMSGVRGPAPGTTGPPTKKAAGGLIPTMAAEKMAVNKGVGGAPSSAKPVVIPNFNMGGGKRETIVANSSEYIIPNFANSGASAIFNQNMVKQYGLPEGAKKIYADGFVPSLAKNKTSKELGNFIAELVRSGADPNEITYYINRSKRAHGKKEEGELLSPFIKRYAQKKGFDFSASNLYIGNNFLGRKASSSSQFSVGDKSFSLFTDSSSKGNSISFNPTNIDNYDRTGFGKPLSTFGAAAKKIAEFTRVLDLAAKRKEISSSDIYFEGADEKLQRVYEKLAGTDKLQFSSNSFRQLVAKRFAADGFIPNMGVVGKLMGKGAYGSFYSLKNGVGVKRFHNKKSITDGDIAEELAAAKYLSGFEISPGIYQPKIFGSPGRSMKARRIGKEVINDPTLLSALPKGDEYADLRSLTQNSISSYVARKVQSVSGIHFRDLHGENLTIGPKSAKTFSDVAQKFLNRAKGDDRYERLYSASRKINKLAQNKLGKNRIEKFIENTLKRNGEKISLIDLGIANPVTDESMAVLHKMHKDFTSGNFADGLIPNLANFGGLNARNFRYGFKSILDAEPRFAFGGNVRLKKRPGKIDYLSDIIEHPELFENYPGMQGIRVGKLPNSYRDNGLYQKELRGPGGIYLKDGRTESETLSTLIHEIQHGIQFQEGSLDSTRAYAQYEKLKKKDPLKAYYRYQSIPAEIEARAAQHLLGSGLKNYKNFSYNDFARNEALRLNKLLGMAGGFVPNLNKPLNESLQREAVALKDLGYSPIQVANSLRVQSSPRLKNPKNPEGLGVFNTLQGQNNINQALADHTGQNLYAPNMATKIDVPGSGPISFPYRNARGGQSLRDLSSVSSLQLVSSADLGRANQAIVRALGYLKDNPNLIKDQTKKMGELTRQLSMQTQALRQKIAGGNSSSVTYSAFQTGQDYLNKIEIERRNAYSAKIEAANIITNRNKEIADEKKRRAETEADELKQKRSDRVRNLGFGASFAIPMAAGALAGFQSSERNANLINGVGSGLGTALLGLGQGPAGAIFAALGVAQAASAFASDGNSRLFKTEENRKKLDEITNNGQRNLSGFQAAQSAFYDINQAKADGNSKIIPVLNEKLFAALQNFDDVNLQKAFSEARQQTSPEESYRILAEAATKFESSINFDKSRTEAALKVGAADKNNIFNKFIGAAGRSLGLRSNFGIQIDKFSDAQSLAKEIANSVDISKISQDQIKNIREVAGGSGERKNLLRDAGLTEIADLVDNAGGFRGAAGNIEKYIAALIDSKIQIGELTKAYNDYNVSQAKAVESSFKIAKDLSALNGVKAQDSQYVFNRNFRSVERSLDNPFVDPLLGSLTRFDLQEKTAKQTLITGRDEILGKNLENIIGEVAKTGGSLSPIIQSQLKSGNLEGLIDFVKSQKNSEKSVEQLFDIRVQLEELNKKQQEEINAIREDRRAFLENSNRSNRAAAVDRILGGENIQKTILSNARARSVLTSKQREILQDKATRGASLLGNIYGPAKEKDVIARNLAESERAGSAIEVRNNSDPYGLRQIERNNRLSKALEKGGGAYNTELERQNKELRAEAKNLAPNYESKLDFQIRGDTASRIMGSGGAYSSTRKLQRDLALMAQKGESLDTPEIQNRILSIRDSLKNGIPGLSRDKAEIENRSLDQITDAIKYFENARKNLPSLAEAAAQRDVGVAPDSLNSIEAKQLSVLEDIKKSINALGGGKSTSSLQKDIESRIVSAELDRGLSNRLAEAQKKASDAQQEANKFISGGAAIQNQLDAGARVKTALSQKFSGAIKSFYGGEGIESPLDLLSARFGVDTAGGFKKLVTGTDFDSNNIPDQYKKVFAYMQDRRAEFSGVLSNTETGRNKINLLGEPSAQEFLSKINPAAAQAKEAQEKVFEIKTRNSLVGRATNFGGVNAGALTDSYFDFIRTPQQAGSPQQSSILNPEVFSRINSSSFTVKLDSAEAALSIETALKDAFQTGMKTMVEQQLNIDLKGLVNVTGNGSDVTVLSEKMSTEIKALIIRIINENAKLSGQKPITSK